MKTISVGTCASSIRVTSFSSRKFLATSLQGFPVVCFGEVKMEGNEWKIDVISNISPKNTSARWFSVRYPVFCFQNDDDDDDEDNNVYF